MQLKFQEKHYNGRGLHRPLEIHRVLCSDRHSRVLCSDRHSRTKVDTTYNSMQPFYMTERTHVPRRPFYLADGWISWWLEGVHWMSFRLSGGGSSYQWQGVGTATQCNILICQSVPTSLDVLVSWLSGWLVYFLVVVFQAARWW